jgi:hypothetical protein
MLVRTSLLMSLCCLVSLPALAQLKLPAPSPSAKVMQTAGLTEITVDYSSPAVKARKIWGGLVPYDQVWRAGANKATLITFSQPVVIGETAVPAGSYSFFIIPSTKEWTLALNKVTDLWGSDEYKKESDVVRVMVKPQSIVLRERLAYAVTNFSNESASIDLEWEKVRVSLPVKLKTAEQAAANIKAAQDGAWAPMFQAARYALETKDYANGLTYIDKSLAADERWVNVWMKAQLLAGQGKLKEAYPLAEKAQALGAKVKPDDFYQAEDIKKALAEWKSKI